MMRSKTIRDSRGSAVRVSRYKGEGIWIDVKERHQRTGAVFASNCLITPKNLRIFGEACIRIADGVERENA
ncbi:hypothetical protein LCGC14_0235090 [marine sediment metagenome]|uniref:Uncharacterized protein n=1 Tax=marine sediment metagenome TaxID=412755 RepID=A0A0F9XD18_9ZZZZ